MLLQHLYDKSGKLTLAVTLAAILSSPFCHLAVAGDEVGPPPMKHEYIRIHYVLNADFTYSKSMEYAVTPLTAEGAMMLAHQPIGMPQSMGSRKNKLKLITAYNRKNNGKRIPASVSEANQANFGGPKVKMLDFKDVEVGDTLVTSFKVLHEKLAIPRSVIMDTQYPMWIPVDEYRVSLSSPASIKLRIETDNVEQITNATKGKTRHMVWQFKSGSNKYPSGMIAGKFIRVHISTFADADTESKALGTMAMASAPAGVRRMEAGASHPTRPFDDLALNAAIPKSYPRPVSAWKTTEKSVYRKLLSHGKFDVLVVPIQVQEYALDQATRALMTAQIALAVTSIPNTRAPDPYLVARALGNGDRRLDAAEVYALANDLGVKKIIWGYAGHDRHYKMALTFQTQNKTGGENLDAATPMTTKSFENIVFSDERPPIEMFQKILPEILGGIGINGKYPDVSKKPGFGDVTEMPPVPLDMTRKNHAPSSDALYFQLLAYLTPYDSEGAREEFAEKSYLAILGLPADSPDYRVLKARSLMLLGLRPAAMQLLTHPVSINEKEMAEMLNGNLPQVEVMAAKMNNDVGGLLAKMDAHFLGDMYSGANRNKTVDAVTSLKLPGGIWEFLFARSYSDMDMWAQYENISLKQLLDHDFPIHDYTAESLTRGVASAGNAEKIQTMGDLSVVNHIRKLLDNNAEKWCCMVLDNHPGQLDYLRLIEAIGEDNLFREANFLTSVQGSPDAALSFLGEIGYVYRDNPSYSWALASAQLSSAEKTDGAGRDGLQESSYENMFNTMYWEQGQSFNSNGSFMYLSSTTHHDYGDPDNFYASDYPFRPYYDQWEMGDWQVSQTQRQISNAEAALRNSIYTLGPLNYLTWFYAEIDKQPDKENALLESVKDRFSGNPKMYQVLIKNGKRNGDTLAVEKYYRESIKAQPLNWDTYFGLGEYFIEQGKLSPAAELFMSYPGFKPDSKENSVGVSNSAEKAGSRFFWLGEFALAKPLFNVSTRVETGANSDYFSRACINLIDGNYLRAMANIRERAIRYDNTYAYRDYLGLLHAMGASMEAWDGFNALADQAKDPHIWESALVGHRKAGSSEKEIAEWASQKSANNIGRTNNYAAKYLLMAGVTDRTPSVELISTLADIAQPVWKIDYNGFTIQSSDDGSVQAIQGPHISDNSILPIAVFQNATKTRVKSSLVYFAEAYRSVQTGDFAAARDSLQEASTLYDFSKDDMGYMLPYYAYAAARSGDVSTVEKYINDFSTEKQGFDYLLAKAAIYGIAGKTDESVQFLQNALYRRISTENRPMQTEYQYADICRLLYEATGKAAFKKIALDWAKKNQVFQPWFAWSYAMEANLSDSKEERGRSVAMAYYLDPKSEMLEKVSKQERDGAVMAFSGRNPFIAAKKPDLPER